MTDPRRDDPGRGSVQGQKLERPAGGGAWRISALIVAALLVGIVVVGRLGMDSPSTSAGPSPSPLAALGSPATTPPPTATASPSVVPSASPAPPALPLATRYSDGLPLAVDGERVLRLANALAVDGGRSFLVGGWYIGPECGGLGGGACPRARLGDTPSAFAVRGGAVDLAGIEEPGAGPRVLRARSDPAACVSLHCPPVLQVEEVVWTGDPLTETGPIDVVPLMMSLGAAFPEMAPAPYNDLPQCPMPWPPQTFLSTSGGPRLTLVFPSLRDRQDAQAAIRAGRSLLLAEQGGECIEQLGRFRGSGRWISEANVMLLLHQGEATLALASAALAEALAASGPAQASEPQPISTWQALRRLWRVEPTLDVGPRLEEPACGARVPPETYRVVHADVRLLALFDSRAERRRFQRAVAAGALSTDSPDCTTLGATPAGASYRWISFENVLLEVRGPEWLDEALAEALRGTGVP